MRTALICTLTVVVSSFATRADALNMSLYPIVVQNDNPVLYYRLNDPASTSTITSEVGGWTGLVSGGVTFGSVPGPLAFGGDTAASFNQSLAGKIDTPHDPAFNTSNYSFEIWARVTGGSSHRSPLTSRQNSPPGGYIFYATPGNTWEFWVGNGTGWHITAGPAVGSDWTHLVGTFDGLTGTKTFYVDGIQVGSVATGVPTSLNTMFPFRIGGGATEGSGQYFFHGDLAEAAYYDYVLSPEQILNHFLAASQEFVVIIPEPATLLLVGFGYVAVAARPRRRRVS